MNQEKLNPKLNHDYGSYNQRPNLRQKDREGFDVKIFPDKTSHLSDWKELWGYRDMIGQLVRRDFVVNYKQTVLGVFWAVIQPIIATIIMGLVFGNLAGLSPAGVPVFLFYLSGQFIWIFFSSCVSATTNTYINNAPLMGKVYFPRFVFPINVAISSGITMLIHIGLFVLLYIIYGIAGAAVRPNIEALLIPIYIVQLAMLGLGVGSLLASITTRYKDAAIMTSYGLLIWMYISPIVYDINIVPDKYLWLYLLNPVAPIIVNIRHSLFGLGEAHWISWVVSLVITVLVFIFGNKMFNKAGKTFVDTI